MVMDSDKNLSSNLALLQNKIKRDPESYKEEFMEKYAHYQSLLQVFHLQPQADCNNLVELIAFISQVAQCYPKDVTSFANELQGLLAKHSQSLDSQLRMSLCKSLILLRNKKLIPELETLRLFFDLFRCRDKELRKFLFSSIVSHIKQICQKDRDFKMNASLQVYIYSKIQDSHVTTARLALLMLIDLYRKNSWHEARTANVIASACFVKPIKVMMTAVKFFVGNVEDEDDGEVSSEEDPEENSRSVKDILMAYRVGKKSNKRKKHMERAKEAVSKSKKKKKAARNLGSSAILLIYDPQEFVERLSKRLESSTDRYEFKVFMMGLIAKCIGVHQLLLLNFYPFIQRYLQPHQRDVTKLLLFAAQATHENVPPDVIESLIKTIVNNFVTERNSAEVMTVGLNTIREICSACPFAISEDLLQDLTEYKTYKNKNVNMAARAMIQLYRTLNPHLLKRKDRGRPTESTGEMTIKSYGRSDAPDFVPGAEVLMEEDEKVIDDNEKDGDVTEDIEEDTSDIEELSDLSEDDQEESGSELEEEAGQETSTHLIEPEASTSGGSEQPVSDAQAKPELSAADKAALLSSTKIFSQKDFRRIQARQLAKTLQPARGKMRKGGGKTEEQQEDAEQSLLDGSDDEDDASDDGEKGPLRLADIEHLSKRRKMDKAGRVAAIMEGREGREKFGRPKKAGAHVGRNNKELAKGKAFSMIKHKQRGKQKRSFRQKQMSLRAHLSKSKRSNYG